MFTEEKMLTAVLIIFYGALRTEKTYTTLEIQIHAQDN